MMTGSDTLTTAADRWSQQLFSRVLRLQLVEYTSYFLPTHR